MSLLSSADERFDATFHTNVLVNPSGSCQYMPPGKPAFVHHNSVITDELASYVFHSGPKSMIY